MSKKMFALAAGAALALPAAAPAATGSALTEKGVYDLGKCIVRADRDMAGELLETLPLNGGNKTLGAGDVGEAAKCLKGGALTVPAVSLRGAIAQALFLRDFERFAVQPRVSEDLFAGIRLPVSGETEPATDAKTAALYKLGDCVVRNEAMRIEMLLRSSPGSSLENNIIDHLGPTMSACQNTAETVRVSRANLRSVLAQAAYNVSVRYWTGKLWTASR